MNDARALNIDDEREILLAVSRGSHQMYAKLYAFYLNEVYRYVFLFTQSEQETEDIVQQAFLKIWEKRAYLVGVRSFKSYVYKVAKNLLMDEVRKKQTESKVLTLIKPTSEESMERTDDNIIYGQYYQLVQETIAMLPEKRKQIVVMRLFDDMSLDEIADRLAVSKSVVKKQFYAGIEFIRRRLGTKESIIGILLWLTFI